MNLNDDRFNPGHRGRNPGVAKALAANRKAATDHPALGCSGEGEFR